MARRTLNRMDLRRAAESTGGAEARDDDEDEGKEEKASEDADGEKPKKKAAKPRAKSTKPRKSAKSKAPIRMRVRWAVVNDSLKQVAVFDYPQRKLADEKAADMVSKGKGHHFVRAIKEAMPEVPEVVV